MCTYWTRYIKNGGFASEILMLAMQKQLWPLNNYDINISYVRWIYATRKKMVGYGVVYKLMNDVISLMGGFVVGLNQFQPPDAHIGIRPLTIY